MDQQPQKQPEETSGDTDVPTPPKQTDTPQTPSVESESASAPEPVVSEQPAVEPAVSAPAPTATAPSSDSSRPNQLAALMLTSSFGYYGVHQLYLGNKTQGFVRLGLAVLAIPLLFVAVGALIVLVLAVWTLYDFVRIGLGKATDVHGKELVASKRDANWSKILTIVALVGLGLYILLAVLFVSLGVFGVLNGSLESTTPTGPVYEYEF